MSDLFESYDVLKCLGSEITIAESFPAIYVSERDGVYCFTGVLQNDDKRHQVTLDSQPFYMCGKHSTDKHLAPSIKGFFHIANGCIYLDNYADNQYDKSRPYKLTNRFIRLPVAASTYYGAMEHYTIAEDEKLTRKVFGITCDILQISSSNKSCI